MPGLELCETCNAPVSGRGAAGPAPGGSGGELELDLDLPAPPRPVSAAAAEPGPALAAVSSPGAVRAGGSALYEVEVQRIAGYGAPPSSFLGSVLYALHVLSRRRVLVSEVEEAKALREATDAAARRALVDLGRLLSERAPALGLGQLGPRLEAVQRASAQLEGGSAEDRAREQEIRTRLGELDARIREAQADANPWRDKETRVSTQHKAREAELERLRARLKRIEIELRNLRARNAGDAELAPLEAEAEARRAEIAVAEGPVRALTDELATVRRELAVRTAAAAQLEDERRALDDALRQIADARAASSSRAGRALEDAYIALAEEAHTCGLDAPLAAEAARVEAALAQLEERRRREAIQARALDAYDRPAMKRGAIILGAVGFLIFATIVLAIVK